MKRPWHIYTIAVLATVISVVLLPACAADTRAPVHNSDPTPTSAYLHARRTVLLTTLADLPSVERAVQEFVARTDGRCRGAMLRAPNSGGYGALDAEAGRAVAAVMRGASHEAMERFDATISNLKWPDARITALVRSLSVLNGGALAVVVPDLCAGIAAWSNSAYRIVPASTRRFNRRNVMLARMEGADKEAAVRPLSLHHCRRARHLRSGGCICSGPGSLPAAGSMGEVILRLLKREAGGRGRTMIAALDEREVRLMSQLRRIYRQALLQLDDSLGMTPGGSFALETETY